jgi:hypothetical protein
MAASSRGIVGHKAEIESNFDGRQFGLEEFI